MPHLESELYAGYAIKSENGRLVAVFQPVAGGDSGEKTLTASALDERIAGLKESGVYADVSVPALRDLRQMTVRRGIQALAFGTASP